MILEKFSTIWAEDYIKIVTEINTELEGLVYAIEHVGSTSVPDLDSKPIIDIDIIYYDLDDFEKIKSGLEKLGYYHNGNQGIEDRDVFKRKGKITNEILDAIQHHLYVCPAESKALERHILSRNFLRKNAWAKLKYQQMKYDLAEIAHQDRKVYAELKELHMNSFIDSMIEEEKRAMLRPAVPSNISIS